MLSSYVEFGSLGDDQAWCLIRLRSGAQMRLSGDLADDVPHVEGDPRLCADEELRAELWAYARSQKQRWRATDPSLRKAHRKQALAHRKAARRRAKAYGG
jgi:hypothetical protein